MLGDGGESPSRYELLNMVRKHSNLLGQTIVDEKDATDVEMDPRFWHDLLDVYFIHGKESRSRQDDDLIFFVRKLSLQGSGFNNNMEGVPPYFVRRWAPKLEKVVDENSEDVDWRRSFYLNLIAHTSFTVTVAICSIQDLQNHQNGADTPLSPVYKVVKTVYASPSHVNFRLDSRKVLTETDHCYCVLLNAHDGAAFPAEKPGHDCSSSKISTLRIDTDSGRTKNSKLTLFSGFVSYQMVREAYDAYCTTFRSGKLCILVFGEERIRSSYIGADQADRADLDRLSSRSGQVIADQVSNRAFLNPDRASAAAHRELKEEKRRGKDCLRMRRRKRKKKQQKKEKKIVKEKKQKKKRKKIVKDKKKKKKKKRTEEEKKKVKIVPGRGCVDCRASLSPSLSPLCFLSF